MESLKEIYEIDRKTWDECAETYERQIVGGHPDILAFEEFEEDLLDRILGFLAKEQSRSVKLMDIGCGSGRLHIRYGAKTKDIGNLPESHPLVSMKKGFSKYAFDPLLARSLGEIWGIDFSGNMIRLAEEKLIKAGLREQDGVGLSFEKGSAFDLMSQSKEVLPVAVCLVNSIGVMQGREGAAALFRSMRKAVADAGGIAIISCYRQEYLESYGLGQYESTMDVSGQPVWLTPAKFTDSGYKQLPRQYKRAHSGENRIIVDVFDQKDQLVSQGHVLDRDPEKTRSTLRTGDVETHSSYRSHWYSFEFIEQLIRDQWDGPDSYSYHLKTKDLDVLRAEPAQLALLDFSGRLESLLKLWDLI